MLNVDNDRILAHSLTNQEIYNSIAVWLIKGGI